MWLPMYIERKEKNFTKYSIVLRALSLLVSLVNTSKSEDAWILRSKRWNILDSEGWECRMSCGIQGFDAWNRIHTEKILLCLYVFERLWSRLQARIIYFLHSFHSFKTVRFKAPSTFAVQTFFFCYHLLFFIDIFYFSIQ